MHETKPRHGQGVERLPARSLVRLDSCIVHNDDRIALPTALAAIRRRRTPRAPRRSDRAQAHAGSSGWLAWEVWAAGPDAVLNSTVIPSGRLRQLARRWPLSATTTKSPALSRPTLSSARVAARFDMVLIRFAAGRRVPLCTTKTINTPLGARATSSSSSEAIEDAVLRHAAASGELHGVSAQRSLDRLSRLHVQETRRG